MGKRNSGRIKRPRTSSGNRFSAEETPNYDEYPPVFSLERLQGDKFCLSRLDQVHKAAFADAIYQRRCVTWRELKQIGRHGIGFEKIPKSRIKAAIPLFITDEHEHFLAFRFSGLAPMVGYRLKNIFYVLWFDANFELYDH